MERSTFDGFCLYSTTEANERMPQGWVQLWTFAKSIIYRLNGTFTSCEKDEKGLLRVHAVSADSLDNELLQRLMQTIARDSARICLQCGAVGYRRKLEAGWPTLCASHYVEYVNS